MLKYKVVTLTALAATGLACPSHAALLIKGVINGTLSDNRPKAVVLQASSNVDLSLYGIENARGSSNADGPDFILSGSASAGDFILITYGAGNETFSLDFFVGTSPDYFTDNFITFNDLSDAGNNSADINGDDTVVLYLNDEALEDPNAEFDLDDKYDTFGQLGIDGSGTFWDYSDGYAVRKETSTDPDPNFSYTQQGNDFTSDNYIIGKDALDAANNDPEAHADLIAEAFGFTRTPEPGSLSLLAVGGLLLARRRRS